MAELGEKQILIVDDDRVNRLVLETLVKQEGYGVVTAEGGEQALHLLGFDSDARQNPHHDVQWDAVILDIMMPVIDGLEVLRRIREHWSANELPVIMATAMDQGDDVVSALEQGANDYVVKPIDLPVLLARLRTQVSLRRTHLALKEAQQSLIGAARMEAVGYLAAGVAHEIRNPLAQIQMGVDAIESSEVLDSHPQLKPVTKIVFEAVEKADLIIRELMKVSKSGELSLRPGSVNETLEEISGSIVDATELAGVELELRLEPGLPSVLIAATEMQAVFRSLMMNAVDAMSHGGKLEVITRVAPAQGVEKNEGTRSGLGLRQGEACVVIEVLDTGSGIPADKMQVVFDPFFTTKPTGQGMGMGLSVARKMVELHHGSISIENREDSPGVRVLIQLPKAESRQTLV